eukprot:sb/3476849/
MREIEKGGIFKENLCKDTKLQTQKCCFNWLIGERAGKWEGVLSGKWCQANALTTRSREIRVQKDRRIGSGQCSDRESVSIHILARSRAPGYEIEACLGGAITSLGCMVAPYPI